MHAYVNVYDCDSEDPSVLCGVRVVARGLVERPDWRGRAGTALTSHHSPWYWYCEGLPLEWIRSLRPPRIPERQRYLHLRAVWDISVPLLLLLLLLVAVMVAVKVAVAVSVAVSVLACCKPRAPVFERGLSCPCDTMDRKYY